jgi:hypothetical protein
MHKIKKEKSITQYPNWSPYTYMYKKKKNMEKKEEAKGD